MSQANESTWLFQELSSLRRELQEQHQRIRSDVTAVADRIDGRLSAIEAQTTLTNGRTRKAEIAIAVLQTKQYVTWAIAAGVWALVLVIAGWLLGIVKG